MDLELEKVELVPLYLVDLELERVEIVPVYLVDLELERVKIVPVYIMPGVSKAKLNLYCSCIPDGFRAIIIAPVILIELELEREREIVNVRLVDLQLERVNIVPV